MENRITKHCKKCQVELVSPDNWYSSSLAKNHYLCIPCIRSDYQTNREQKISYQRQYYKNRETNMNYKIEKIEEKVAKGQEALDRLRRNQLVREVQSSDDWDDYDYGQQAALRRPIDRKFYYLDGFGWCVTFGDHIYKATPAEIKEHFRDE